MLLSRSPSNLAACSYSGLSHWQPLGIIRTVPCCFTLPALCPVSPPALTPSRPYTPGFQVYCSVPSSPLTSSFHHLWAVTAASWFANMYLKPNSIIFTPKPTSLPANAYPPWSSTGRNRKPFLASSISPSSREEEAGAVAVGDPGLKGKWRRCQCLHGLPPPACFVLFPTFSLAC